MADPSVGEPDLLTYNFAALRVRTGTTVRLVVKGEIDLATSSRLREQVEQLRAGDAELVIVDLERVTFIDSTGLGVLLESEEQLDGRLRIAPSPSVLRLLEITGTRGMLPIIDPCPEITPRRPVGRPRPLRSGH